jgi:DNA invertase Pin-like site-specific DNA recombinase
MNTRQAIAYVRASTNPDLQANSISIQTDLLQAFAKQHNYEITNVFVEYSSGGDDERPVMNEALEHAISNGVNLISWKVDRFARSLSIFSRIQEHLHLLRFTELGDTEPNVMVLSVLLGVAYQERKNTSIRVKASYKYLKAKDPNLAWGNPNMASNVQPIGQQKRISNAVAFNTKLQGIVNDLRSAGYSTMNEIAYRLNEMNITTRRGKPFTKNNLQRVLQYKG